MRLGSAGAPDLAIDVKYSVFSAIEKISHIYFTVLDYLDV